VKLTSERAKEIRKLRENYPLSTDPKQWDYVKGTDKLALVAGIVNGDGHLQLGVGRGLVSFYSKNMYEIKHFENLFSGLFNRKSIIYKNYKNSGRHRIYYSGKPLAGFLKEAGVVVGNKTNIEYLIPYWIVGGNPSIRTNYLRGLYDTEGTICYSRRRWQISITQSKNECLKENGIRYFNQIRDILVGFGMSPSPVMVCMGNRKPRKDGSKTLVFKLDLELKDFDKFRSCIGFNNRKKLKRLNKALNV
jgi:hypothetical protein